MDKPPDHLYHYTSIEGLMGILTNRSLWATEIYFLNDTEELRYSDGVLKKVCDELLKEHPIPLTPDGQSLLMPTDPQTLLGRFYSYIKNLFFARMGWYPIFVFSLSEEKDLLSQWRAYCPSVGGYSIGFRSDLLIELLKTVYPKNLFLERCIYEKKDQEAEVKQMIIEKGDTFLKGLPGNPVEEYLDDCRFKFQCDFLRQKAAALKDPSFHEEREWRIVSDRMGSPDILFRIRKSTLVPYLAISFEHLTPFLIDEIIIGPGPQQNLAYSALDQFCFYNNLLPLMEKIKTSKIPYRA